MSHHLFSSLRIKWFNYKRWSNFRMNGDLRLLKAKPLKRLTFRYIILPFKYIIWHKIIVKGWRDEIDLEINSYVDDTFDDIIHEKANEIAEEHSLGLQECFDL